MRQSSITGNLTPLHSLKSETDYKKALAEIERLFDAAPETADGDRLDVLALLVEAYEEQHHPILPPDPVVALEYYMESRGLSRRDLEPYLGSRARVAEVLNRRRELMIEMIRHLHHGLGISADVLIQPYSLDRQPLNNALRPTLPATISG